MPATTDKPRRWLVVPENLNIAGTIAFARILIGVLWLFEVTVGHNWKLGGFGSGTNPGWVGPGAGDTIREEIALAVEDGTWMWVAWLYQNLIDPNAAAFSYLVIVVQVALGLTFVFGLAVRPMALLALVFDLSIFFLGNSRIPPFFSAFHLLLLYSNAGMYYGADGWILRRLRGSTSRAAAAWRWLVELPPLVSTRFQTAVLVGATLASAYFFLQMVVRPTERMDLVAMELAVLFGLVAAAVYFGRQADDRLAVVAALLRVFVGFKFLHEIWVRVEPGVNGLPGWADSTELFELVAANHWAPFSWLVDVAILPIMVGWIVLFGVVQFGVGILLLVGYRTREVAMVGLVYLALLGVLGFTRYVPFLFGLLVVVLALDAGRTLSLDARTAAARPPRYGLPIPRVAVPVLATLAAANFVAAAFAVVLSGGIAPDGYEESMGQMTTAMVAIFSGLFALVGWLQLRTDDTPRVPSTTAVWVGEENESRKKDPKRNREEGN